MTDSHDAVLHFWFETLEPKHWFSKDDAVDAEIKQRFGELHSRAAACELNAWRVSPEGRLAEIIVLDQFSRNIHRGDARSFACDTSALILAQEAVTAGADRDMSPVQRSFLYMPYMHSESLYIHEAAVKLYDQPGLEHNLDFEIRHKVIIERFGRYPHRNEILGRQSTSEELEFLQQPGSGF